MSSNQSSPVIMNDDIPPITTTTMITSNNENVLVIPPPLEKYGNSKYINNRNPNTTFYGVGNMAPILSPKSLNYSDSFELISLENHQQDLQELSDKKLNVSLILSGGRASGVFSIFMIKGMEKEGFFLGKGNLKYLTFENLMNDSNIDLTKSRRFNRCLACCEGYLIIEMEDFELYLFDIIDEKFKYFKFEKQIQLIASNIMSSIIALYFKDHTMIIVDLSNSNKIGNEIKLINNSPLKILTKYAADLFIFVHQDDSMYIYRNDEETDGFINIPENVTSEIETLEFNSIPIKQVIAGYSHFIVLLENGKCYTRGMNNYGQINGKTGGEGATICQFHPLLHDLGHVVECVNCSSLSTTLETENEIIIIGEVSQTFKKLDYPHCNGMNSFWVHRKEYSDETTSFGPWHGFIYRATFLQSTLNKTLTYFKNNLKKLRIEPKLSDISINSCY